MDELLNLRYRLLFEAYENGNVAILAPLKERLGQMVNEGILRPDAALYLISNFDLMLVRPYFGQIYALSNSGISELPTVLPQDNALETLFSALEDIFRSLKGEAPYSSHAVSLAVEGSWESLSKKFGWA